MENKNKMKQIRNNIFETNSSSTHVLVIDSGEKCLKLINDEEYFDIDYIKSLDYYIDINAQSGFNPYDYYYHINSNDQFQRDPFICKTFDSKIDYLYTVLCRDDEYPNWENELCECIANRYKISKDNIIFESNYDHIVDHGIEHLNKMLQDVGSIKNILENDKYYILSLGEEE